MAERLTLPAIAASHMMRPFRLAGADCVRSALAASDEITGNDAATRVRRIYASAVMAASIREQWGGTGRAIAGLYAALGFRALTDGLYQPGDVAVIRDDTLGVWIGDGWACKTRHGMVVLADAPTIHYRPCG